MRLMVPSVGTPIGIRDILQGLSGDEDLPEVFRRYTGVKYCYFTNSGTTAFYLILRALRTLSSRRKVVLPAYTAPSLILPIRKAGLRPALAEVSLDTFNLDVDRLEDYVDEDTLCVVPVHMFGLPCDMTGVGEIARGKGAFVVEDAASSMGSELNGRPTGTLGDLGFYSFNRGKNLTTLTGGCVVTDSDCLGDAVEGQWRKLPRPSGISRLLIPAKTVGLALAFRPLGYTLLYPIVVRFKYTELHTDFEPLAYTEFQARMGGSLFMRAGEVFRTREENGTFLYNSLSGIEGLKLPRIPPNSKVAFNQFPILLEDEAVRDSLHLRIRKELGLETTLLYPEPIHRIYDLGYDASRDPFPNSTYLARRLLLIPTHPLVRREMLERVVELIKGHLSEGSGACCRGGT
ncbi:MAG: hypothetical protein DRP94_07830 [Candidatus Latescibacterota bacterium]|nr:MAG: hypothetical protein DRP94_07830 [Candidatus Latescibacterota bacterium]RKY73596.1 MAG: hypothetical protein DRQ14_03785 [Candidatus Latescibacterota bacterium]